AARRALGRPGAGRPPPRRHRPPPRPRPHDRPCGDRRERHTPRHLGRGWRPAVATPREPPTRHTRPPSPTLPPARPTTRHTPLSAAAVRDREMLIPYIL